MTFQSKAKTLGDAVTLGARETLEDVTAGYRVLAALGTNRVSPRLIGGPISIFKMALQYADEGTPRLLLFLTFLRAVGRHQFPADPRSRRRALRLVGL